MATLEYYDIILKPVISETARARRKESEAASASARLRRPKRLMYSLLRTARTSRSSPAFDQRAVKY